jgi:hypothetical protein
MSLGFVVRRDWKFDKSGKLAAIFQKLYRSENPQKDRHQPMPVSFPSLGGLGVTCYCDWYYMVSS